MPWTRRFRDAVRRHAAWAAGLILSAAMLLGTLSEAGGQGPAAPAPSPAPEGREYVGSELCAACHADQAHEVGRTLHGKTIMQPTLKPGQGGCESCHGPGSAHLADPTGRSSIVNPARLSAADAAGLCLRCHASPRQVRDPRNQVSTHEWLASEHATAGVSCVTCHNPMKSANETLLRKPANELCLSCHFDIGTLFKQRSHHPLHEGQVRCVDCHDPMRGREPHMVRARGNELCTGCHKDKQGPFLFEHGAMSDALSDGCLGCHMPHGANQDHLLEYAGRATCLQCHSDRVATGPTAHFAGNCTTCHVNIHGSNRNPSFFP